MPLDLQISSSLLETCKTYTYRGVCDRSEWGNGPWDDEPDKIEWTDEVTTLPCIASRGPFGSWCGYVGVSEDHPFFNVAYSAQSAINVDVAADLLEARGAMHSYSDELLKGSVPIEALLEAHGGITYSNFSRKITHDSWREFQVYLEKLTDSARRLKEWSHLMHDFKLYEERVQAVGILHHDYPDVWWFGFDCAHAGDSVPGVARHIVTHSAEIYRSLAYVQDGCRKLARQLKLVQDS